MQQQRRLKDSWDTTAHQSTTDSEWVTRKPPITEKEEAEAQHKQSPAFPKVLAHGNCVTLYFYFTTVYEYLIFAFLKDPFATKLQCIEPKQQKATEKCCTTGF